MRQELASGPFHSVEEVLLHALKISAQKTTDAVPPAQLAGTSEPKPTGQALIDAFAEIRSLLSDEEIDTIFTRNRLPSRPG